MIRSTQVLRMLLLIIMTTTFAWGCPLQEPHWPLEPVVIDGDVSDSDIAEDIEEDEDIEDHSSVYPFIGNDCVQCQWYFCPPLDSVWQKHICIDYCENPPQLLHEGECVEYLQCDPTQYHIEDVECITVDGYPGMQEKVCNKGQIQYTDCITECKEEVCNGEDDDCDGEIDEDQLNACGECGIEPPEICDGVDNDCNGSTDEDLYQPCFTACGSGYETCQMGQWNSCTAPPVIEEICDGLDNDCDGQIDEGLTCVCTIQDVGTLFPCNEDPLLCGQGFKTCECIDDNCQTIVTTECKALCHYFPDIDPNCDPLIGMPLQEELCNNFDDNCNQQIDEDLYNLCYTGPNGTMTKGICQPGEMTCNFGSWGSFDNGTFIPGMCEGEITPQEEVCNGIDDDCDGIIDTGEEMQETDILFIVDWSGSMSTEISAVLAALNSFANQYSDEQVIQWGLIIGPDVPPSDYGNKNFLHMISNLTNFSNFMSDFTTLNGTPQAGQHEMLYDAIYLAIANISGGLTYDISDLMWPTQVGKSIEESVPPLEDFVVNWRPNAKKVIVVFSDEIGQSFLFPKAELGNSWNTNDTITEDKLVTAVSATPNLKVYTFSTAFTKDSLKGPWEPIATASGGKWYLLSNSVMEMYNAMMEIIDENACSTGQ